MDKGILQSINSRRDALYAHYDLPPDARRKAEALFARMEHFGLGCRDQADFENKFATLTLNREYNGLFVEFTAYVKTPGGAPTVEDAMREGADNAARSTVRQKTRSAARNVVLDALPDEARQWYTYGIYKIPVLGQIASAFNQMHMLKRIFGRRKKQKDENDDQNI